MDNTTTTESQTVSELIQRLCEAEGSDIVLQFKEPISVPTARYDGRSYGCDTFSKTTLNATIRHAEIKDLESEFFCLAAIELNEFDQIGVGGAIAGTESNTASPEHSVFEIRASRAVDAADGISVQDVKQAIKDGRTEETLPPWAGFPTARVTVGRTTECHERFAKSDSYIQYRPPLHEVGTLIGVRIGE